MQAANQIARYVHRNGSVFRFDLERTVRGMSRRMSLDQLLAAPRPGRQRGPAVHK